MNLKVARHILAWVSAVWITAGAARALAPGADVVLLKNGDRITGRVLTTSADTVSLQTDAAGIITIRRDAIERVLPEPTAAPLTAPSTRIVAPDPQAQPIATLTSVPPKSHCLEHLKPVPVTWAIQFQGAPNEVVVGTVSQDLFGAGLEISSCEGNPRNQTSLAAQGSHSRFYERNSGAITADVADAELEQQHFFRGTQGTAILVVGDVFNNNALGMAMQKSVGVGLLSAQYKYKAAAYDFAGDIRYINQHLDGVSTALNLAAIRLKEQAHLDGKLFHLDEQGWIMPALNDVHALQAYGSMAPSVTLKPWLTLGISEEESYLENAPYPRLKNYFTSTVTLTLHGGSGSK
ncbi:MAG: hypothetical protein HIU91_09045 [Acidobacteria bacterium]|nr:hypothetical protein [Acidobacteriota bacterium]